MRGAGVVATWCTCAWVGALCQSASAQALEGVQLSWDAPPSCAPTPRVLLEARRLLGSAFQNRDTLEVTIEIEDLGDAFELRLDLEGEATEGERELRMQTCQEVRDAAALLIALSLDPELAQRAEPEPEPEAPGRPPELELELPTVGFDGGLLPRPAPWLGAHVALRFGAFRAALGASYLVPNAVTVAPRTPGAFEPFALDFDVLAGRAGLCWEPFGDSRWLLGPCAEVWVGTMSAQADYGGAAAADQLLLAGALHLRGAYSFSSLVSVAARAGALVPRRPRFGVTGETVVHEAGSISVQAEISLVFRFPLGG